MGSIVVNILPFFFCLPLLLPNFVLLANASHNYEETMKQTLPAYSIASRAHLLNFSKCAKELEVFKDGVDRRLMWSLKVLDSSGGVKPGFVYGNNYWLGSRNQCEDSTNKKSFVQWSNEQTNNLNYKEIVMEVPPFQVRYFVVHLTHNSTLQYHIGISKENLITLGVCLPASCTVPELSTIMEEIIRERSLLFNDLYSADFKLFQVRDLKDDHRWLGNAGVVITAFSIILIIALVIIGTIYDVVVHQRYLRKTRKFLHCVENTSTSLEIGANGTGEPSERIPSSSLSPMPPNFKPKSYLGNIILCFSIYSNTKIIFNTRLEGESIPAIHGFKFFGMLWIIMVHTLYYMLDVMDNKVIALRTSQLFLMQIISNSTLSVDTFFFLGGFLVAHLYLKRNHEKKESVVNVKRKIKQFFLGIFNRFVRLTPAYMMTIGIVELNANWYDKTSEFYMNEKPHETCAKYWWRNILYIQNFFSRDTMCLSWSWYLANDMQFFIISTFLLTLSSIYLRTTIALFILLLVSSTIITGYTSYSYRYIPTLGAQYSFLDVLYDPPWTRIGPYIVGILTAFIVIKLKHKLNLNKISIVLCWCIGSCCNLLVLFGVWEKRISILSAAFYTALSRTVWAIGISWVFVACYTKRAGMVNRLLSYKIWIPFSRLTYCAYLLNPFLITSTYLHNESSVHVNALPQAIWFLGTVIITYLCAYLYSVMFETPFILLLRQYTNRK